MIRKSENYKAEIRKNMRGGNGKIKILHIWDEKNELKADTRLFAKLVLEPECGIGYHTHENEEEVFYIIKGTAEVDDNGEKITLRSGDSILTGEGKGHSITNTGNDDLEVLAVISCY